MSDFASSVPSLRVRVHTSDAAPKVLHKSSSLRSSVLLEKNRSIARGGTWAATWLSTFLALSMIILNIVIYTGYFLSINAHAAKGYEMKQVYKKLDQVTAEQKQLAVQVAEASSLASVQNSLTGTFVPITDTEFLKPSQLSKR
jgi:hypothetical protein